MKRDFMHLAGSLVDVKKAKRAKVYFDEALDSIRLEKNIAEDNYIYMLLYYYSQLKLSDKANECYSLIKHRNLKRDDAFVTHIYGKYYELLNHPDSAIACYERIFNEGKDEYAMYDVSKDLFRLYSQKGDIAKANRYGAEFIRLSKELDLSKNQKLAATVNNKYKYNLDRRLMQRTEQERVLYLRAVERLGDITEHQRQACYLMRIGMNNPQINSLADMPRTSIWRWTKAQAWIYALPRT